MNPHDELVPFLNQQWDIAVPSNATNDQLSDVLAEQINRLIESNFERLVNLLYRVDVSESKLKKILLENPDADAGRIIATLVLERQLEKIRSRREYRPRDNAIDEEEKW